MTILGMAIGVVIMIGQRIAAPTPFFAWKTETADPVILEP